MRASLHQPHHPHLREPAHTLPTPLLGRPNPWLAGVSGTSRQVPLFRFPGGCYSQAALRAAAPDHLQVIQSDVASGDAFVTRSGGS
jgi:hypothetical protein